MYFFFLQNVAFFEKGKKFKFQKSKGKNMTNKNHN